MYILNTCKQTKNLCQKPKIYQLVENINIDGISPVHPYYIYHSCKSVHFHSVFISLSNSTKKNSYLDKVQIYFQIKLSSLYEIIMSKPMSTKVYFDSSNTCCCMFTLAHH